MHFLLLQRANGEWLRCKWPAGTLSSSLPELGQAIRVEVELKKNRDVQQDNAIYG